MGAPRDPKSFETATVGAAAQGSDSVNEICAKCQSNWIKIRYEYEDGTGVPEANYVVQTVTADGSPTGEIIAEGKTDGDGNAHVVLPDEHQQVEFYFHNVPEGEPYEDPEAAKPLEEPEPGFWKRLWENISDGADWIWGVLKGDFEEDPSTSQIIGRMILTMIPGIDQLADVQDIVNILCRLIWKQEWHVKMHWVLLVITLIGLIPVLGSLAKGLLKLVIKKAGDVSALRALYGIFNYFKKGNAHRWIRDFANDLTGKHLTAALALLMDMMTRVIQHMEAAKGWLSWGWNAQLEAGIAKAQAFMAIAPAKLTDAATYLQKQLLDTLRVGMSRTHRKSTKNTEPHVVKQEKAPPGEAPQGGAARSAQYGDGWPKGDINRSVEEFAGPNPNVTTTGKGKRINENPETGLQVVEDTNGGYYRIYDPSLPGRRKYLGLDGNIPNNKIVDGRQIGRTQAEYNQVTHFWIE